MSEALVSLMLTMYCKYSSTKPHSYNSVWWIQTVQSLTRLVCMQIEHQAMSKPALCSFSSDCSCCETQCTEINLNYRLTWDLLLILDHLSYIPGFLLYYSSVITNITDAQCTPIAISSSAYSYSCPETQILNKAFWGSSSACGLVKRKNGNYKHVPYKTA